MCADICRALFRGRLSSGWEGSGRRDCSGPRGRHGPRGRQTAGAVHEREESSLFVFAVDGALGTMLVTLLSAVLGVLKIRDIH